MRLCEGGGPLETIEWSSSGEWICFRDQQGLHVVKPDGHDAQLLQPAAAGFTFAPDGASVYVLRRSAEHHWELVRVSLPGGIESERRLLKVPREATVSGLRLHPDGKRFIATLEASHLDLWILDGFSPPRKRFARLGW